MSTFHLRLLAWDDSSKQADLVCVHKDAIKEVNKIFNFVWKGRDRVKRSTLIANIENGGLRAPHLESIIKTQPIVL